MFLDQNNEILPIHICNRTQRAHAGTEPTPALYQRDNTGGIARWMIYLTLRKMPPVTHTPELPQAFLFHDYKKH